MTLTQSLASQLLETRNKMKIKQDKSENMSFMDKKIMISFSYFNSGFIKVNVFFVKKI